MEQHAIKLTCAGGHEQTILVEGQSREWCEAYAKVLDLTDPMFLHPPTEPKGVGAGYCAVCGARFKATVEYIDSVIRAASPDTPAAI